jgi:hypothetical protein
MIKHIFKSILTVWIAILALSLPGWAATYYMRSDGSAANKAAAVGPVDTVANCMNVTIHNGETFDPGDIIIVSDAGGVYKTEGDITSSGSATAGINYGSTTAPNNKTSPTNNILYLASGSPVFDGADSISAGSWSVYSGSTYQATITLATGPVTALGNYPILWQDGIHMILGSSKDTLTAGQYYCTPGVGGSQTMYVCATSGTPDTNGATYEYNARQFGIYGFSASYITYDGLICKRNLYDSGSLYVGQYSTIRNCQANEGNKHSLYVRKGSYLYNCSCTNLYYPLGATFYVYNDDIASLDITFESCSCNNSGTLSASTNAFYGHANTSGHFGIITILNCTANDCSTPLSQSELCDGYNVTNFTCNNCTSIVSIGADTTNGVNINGVTATNMATGWRIFDGEGTVTKPILMTNMNVSGSAAVSTGGMFFITASRTITAMTVSNSIITAPSTGELVMTNGKFTNLTFEHNNFTGLSYITDHGGANTTSNYIFRYNIFNGTRCYLNDGTANFYYNIVKNYSIYVARPANVYNNVIYATPSAGNSVTFAANASGSNYANNIIMNSTGHAINIITGTTMTIADYNCYYGNVSSNYTGIAEQGAHDILADPKFVTAGTNFHLTPLSPCINKAKLIPGLTMDYPGNAVPQGGAVDIGAYEYNSSGMFIGN